MVNHFSSLLANSIMLTSRYAILPGSLFTAEDQEIVTDDYFGLDLSGSDNTYVGFVTELVPSKLVNREYAQTTLPTQLQDIHNILFPPSSSNYYRQFMLYSYLRIIQAAGMWGHILREDSRISYDLGEMTDYFKTSRTSPPKSSDASFRLMVTGRIPFDTYAPGSTQDFVVQQVGSSVDLLVFSPTSSRYYKNGVPSKRGSRNMASTIYLCAGSTTLTTPVKIGDTGLAFSLSGPIANFTETSNKTWSFSVETPCSFDFKGVLQLLHGNSRAVTNMFGFAAQYCDISYENLWNMHFNEVHSFAGFLLAYVERVSAVWLRKAT